MGKKSGADAEAPPAVEMQPLTEGQPKFGKKMQYDTTGQGRPSVDLARDVVRKSQELTAIKEKEKAGVPLTKQEKKAGNKAKDLKKEIEMDEHSLTMDELCARYDSSATRGMDSDKIPALLKKYGYNELSPPKQTPEIIKFLNQMTGFFSLLLWLGGFLCFVSVIIDNSQTGNAYLGGVLFAVVFITGCFTYLQEAQSSKVMDGFKKLVPAQTVVKRNGVEEDINARAIVPGDIVFVKAGDKVPADIRVFEQTNLKVDNSSLTGESEPQSRGIEKTHENPLETKNLAFGSTLVLEGQGYGMVIRTADNTLIGRIAGLATGTDSTETPIHKEIHHFVLIISAIAISLGITFFILGFTVADYGVVDNVVFMIGIIVANVPEGLLATVTVSLTLTANRMKQKAVLVKHLESVETLGSTTTICSDKTGTLTQNNMSVAAVYYDDKICSVNTLLDNDTQGEFDTKATSFKALHRCGCLCNKTVFDSDKPGEEPNSSRPVRLRKTIGDASETAIVKFCQPLRDIMQHREANPRIAIIPFNSANKWMATIHKQEDADPAPLMLMKGAPERVLERCAFILDQGKPVQLTKDLKDKVYAANEELAGRGMRVLGFAEHYLDPKKFGANFEYETEPPNFPVDGLTFIGLYALIDPPRAGVPEAVLKCHRAGIKVIMVTGDQPTTAKAIAQQVNIIKSDTVEDLARKEGVPKEKIDPARVRAIVVHGSQVSGKSESDGLSPAEWDKILLHHDEIVFARTSPQQKLVIVDNCQKRGMIVAVTGDGVNDSPALKKADIGVAMGIAGSDVSKEAADMILMDDNFASIVNGIEEGRLIFDNLKKSIAYTLSSNIPEITPFLMFILARIPLPLTTVLILTIDLGTDMIPAISLAYETKEADIMNRPPRDAKVDRLVTHKLINFAYFQIGVIQALAGFYVYFIVFNQRGIGLGALFENNLGDNFGEDRYSLFCWRDTSLIGNVQCETKQQTQANYDSANYFADPPTGWTAAGSTLLLNDDSCASLLQEAQTSFLVSIVIVQWADLLICKTRKLSILQQGMRNGVLNFGLIFETLLMVFLCYTPFISDTVFLTKGIRIHWWFAPLPFCLLIFFYDETRKFIIRSGRLFDYGENEKVTNPFSRWLRDHTYW